MSVSEESLPQYDQLGTLGEPPIYQNTESAEGYRSKPQRGRSHPHFEDEELPPTYESLYGQIKEEWLTAENFYEFLKKAGAILLASLACTLLLVIFFILPIAYIVIGVMYLDECPVNKWIPIYLIVAGILGLLQNLLMILRRKVPPNAVISVSYRVYEIMVAIVAFIWFIIGTIWVYEVFAIVCFHKEQGKCYCNDVCYWFAFIMITITYILIVILLIFLVIVILLSYHTFHARAIEGSADMAQHPPTASSRPNPTSNIPQPDVEGTFLTDERFPTYNSFTFRNPLDSPSSTEASQAQANLP